MLYFSYLSVYRFWKNMNILIADATCFGAFPAEKNKSLLNVYLVTKEGINPNDAESAVFVTANNGNIALETAKTKTVQSYLGTNLCSIWMIDNAESKRTKDICWAEFDVLKQNDYYTSELKALKELYTNEFPWALVTKNGELLADTLGIASSNIRNICNPPKKTKGTKLPAVKMNNAGIAYFKNVLNEYRNLQFTISTQEMPIPPLVEAYEKVGHDHMDEAGFYFEKRTIKIKGSRVSSHDTYYARFNIAPRKQIQEPMRRSELGVNLKDPMLRANVNGEWWLFSHKSMHLSLGLSAILAETEPKLVGEPFQRYVKEHNKNPNMIELFPAMKSIHSSPEMLKAIRKLEIEGIDINGKWQPFDISSHNTARLNPLVENISFDIMSRYSSKSISYDKKDVYDLTDAYMAKKSLAEKNFGHQSFAGYLLHPLHDRHLSFRANASHYYWMKWCRKEDVQFE